MINFIQMKRLVLVTLLLSSTFVQAQQVIDRVIAVVGKYPVLMSDLQNAMLDRETYGDADQCKVLEYLVYQKMLVAQADRDSVVVSDQEVENELNRRMAHFINQHGSEEKLEKYYGKRTNVLKDEFRPLVQEQLLADKMSERINGDSKITPAEVRQFFTTIPEDSLPLIESEVELMNLVKRPTYSAKAREETKARLNEYRGRIIKGQSTMSTLARLYSDDEVSAKSGGLIQNAVRGQFVPEFESVAFRLKPGEISEVFETAYGYHIIELVARRGEIVDVRHILLMPRLSNEDYIHCKQQLDSIYAEIKKGTITFEEAVRRFSDDADTKQNSGLMVNPSNASTRFDNEILSKMDSKLIPALSGMVPGDISKPYEYYGLDGKPGFRIIKLKSRIDPHKANLKEDYQRIMNMAMIMRQNNQKKEWIKTRSKNMYIRIEPEYRCQFANDWTISN